MIRTLLATLLDPTDAAGVRQGPDAPGQPPALLRDTVRSRLRDESAAGGLRAAEGPDPRDVLDALDDHWAETRRLRLTADPGLLTATATALAEAVLDAGEESAWAGLRGEDGSARTRLGSLVRRRLRDLDRVAGAAMQAVAERVQHSLRTRFGPGATRFLGDVLVYQRHRPAIHARVRERIDAVDPSLGRSADRPVRLVAHSLGGVIAVDMATAQEPLWTSSLVTFGSGSQAACFHLCDPRGGQLLPTTPKAWWGSPRRWGVGPISGSPSRSSPSPRPVSSGCTAGPSRGTCRCRTRPVRACGRTRRTGP